MPDDENGEHVHGPECGPVGAFLLGGEAYEAEIAQRKMELTDFANRVREMLAEGLSVEHLELFASLMGVLGQVAEPGRMASYWEGMAGMALHMRKPDEGVAVDTVVSCAHEACKARAASRAMAVNAGWIPRKSDRAMVCPAHQGDEMTLSPPPRLFKCVWCGAGFNAFPDSILPDAGCVESVSGRHSWVDA